MTHEPGRILGVQLLGGFGAERGCAGEDGVNAGEGVGGEEEVLFGEGDDDGWDLVGC